MDDSLRNVIGLVNNGDSISNIALDHSALNQS